MGRLSGELAGDGIAQDLLLKLGITLCHNPGMIGQEKPHQDRTHHTKGTARADGSHSHIEPASLRNI
jgi:hypothetical protein